MSVTEVLLWAATVWAVFWAFVIVDVPTLVGRAATRMREQHLLHWARNGLVPPDDDPVRQHGRHRAN